MKDYLKLTIGLVLSYIVPGAVMYWGLFPYLTVHAGWWPSGEFEKALFFG